MTCCSREIGKVNTAYSFGFNVEMAGREVVLLTLRYFYWLSLLSFSYKLVKMLSVCVRGHLCVWMLTRMEHVITAAHRDL